MKKLLMLVTAMVLACAVQASAVAWKLNVASQGAVWSGNGAFVLAFAGSDYDAIVKLVTVTGSESLQSDLAAYALGASTAVKNNRGAASASGGIDPSPDSVFWMVFTDGSYDASKAVTWTAAMDMTGNFYEPPASGTELTLNAASFANSGTIAAVSGGGSGDVPEPTSGLLLVVGGALLALRRKQK